VVSCNAMLMQTEYGHWALSNKRDNNIPNTRSVQSTMWGCEVYQEWSCSKSCSQVSPEPRRCHLDIRLWPWSCCWRQ
jgi:hypothetical protein